MGHLRLGADGAWTRRSRRARRRAREATDCGAGGASSARSRRRASAGWYPTSRADCEAGQPPDVHWRCRRRRIDAGWLRERFDLEDE